MITPRQTLEFNQESRKPRRKPVYTVSPLLALAAGLLSLAAGCRDVPVAAADTASKVATPVAAGEVSEVDPVARSGHDPKAVLALLKGRWNLSDDGNGSAAWGVAGSTLMRRGADGEAHEGWIEAPMPGLLRVRLPGMSTWELGVALDGQRVALGPGRAGQCGPRGCWLADTGLVHAAPDGQCWWFPHRVGGGSIPRFLSPVALECALDQHTFTYHLPRRTRPGKTERRQVRRDGDLLLDQQVAVVTRVPVAPPLAPLIAPPSAPDTTALLPEGGALRPNPAP